MENSHSLSKFVSNNSKYTFSYDILFYFICRTVPGSSFEQDFPEIMKIRLEKKKKRREEELERRKKLSELNPKIYSKLVTSCSDVIYRRRDIRKGFMKWLELAQKESKAIVSAPRRHSLLTKKEFHDKNQPEGKEADPEHLDDVNKE